MKTVWMRSILIAAVATSYSASAAPVPELEEYRGRVVWLDFWASWCGPCRQSFPWMQRLQQRFANAGLTVVAVNLGHEKAAAERFLAGFPHDFVVRFDSAGTLPSRLNVNVMPTSIILDRHGLIHYTHAGFKVTDESEYEAEIEQLLQEKVKR